MHQVFKHHAEWCTGDLASVLINNVYVAHVQKPELFLCAYGRVATCLGADLHDHDEPSNKAHRHSGQNYA